MTEVRQEPTPRVRFRGVRFNEVSVKRELTVGLMQKWRLLISII